MKPSTNHREGASSQMELSIKCPTCGTSTTYSKTNESRPFCSDRCKTGDLAAWASELYAVPVADKSSEDEDNQDID
jgi:uncharacterized protein